MERLTISSDIPMDNGFHAALGIQLNKDFFIAVLGTCVSINKKL